MRPLRIDIVAGAVDRAAGSHYYHLELSRRLAARGHGVTVFCFKALPEVRDWATVYELPRRRRGGTPFAWRFAPLLELCELGRGMRRVRREGADVAVCGEHLLVKGYVRMFPDTATVYFPHALYTDLEFSGPALSRSQRIVSQRLYRHLQRWALDHTACTVRFTESACRALAARYGRHARGPRFVVNPPGVELPPARACDRPGATAEVRLLTVGRLVWSKGLDTALAALAPLRHLRWAYDIVGDGEARGELEALTRELGLHDRVHFHGHQRDPDAWYRNADLFVFPSRFESYGMVLLESMAHGVPCLAVRADGARYHNANAEIIEPGVDGFLAESDDDFGRQVAELLAHPGPLRAAGKRARERVIERHHWDRHLDRYEALFAALTAARTAPAC